MQIKKILGILLALCFLMSVTVAAVSASGTNPGITLELTHQYSTLELTLDQTLNQYSTLDQDLTLNQYSTLNQDLTMKARRDTTTLPPGNMYKYVTKNTGITTQSLSAKRSRSTSLPTMNGGNKQQNVIK